MHDHTFHKEKEKSILVYETAGRFWVKNVVLGEQFLFRCISKERTCSIPLALCLAVCQGIIFSQGIIFLVKLVSGVPLQLVS